MGGDSTLIIVEAAAFTPLGVFVLSVVDHLDGLIACCVSEDQDVPERQYFYDEVKRPDRYQ